MLDLRSIFVFVGSTLLSSGCATTAGSASYEALHGAYDRSASSASSAAPGASSASADAAHDVAAVAAAPSLDRTAFVAAVLRRNPTIGASRQAWRAALARVKQAGVFDDPMVDVGVAPLSIGSSRARFGYEASISQRLPWFGKRALEANAASYEAEAARSDFEATKRDLAMTALTLYDQYFLVVHSLAINAHHRELVTVLRASAAAQFESGRGSAQDPLEAEAELSQLEREAAVLSSRRDVTRAQMNELLHRPPGEPLPPPPQELPLLPAPDVTDAARLEKDAAETRPEIAAARHRAAAAQARADRAGREYLPDFTVSTSYNSMWDLPEHRWMVGLGFNLPIQTGRRAGLAEEANAMRAGFENDANRLEDASRTQVFVALTELDESNRVLHLYESRLIPVARDEVDAARAALVAARSPFSAVIAAEKNLRSVELDYQTARAECDLRRAELERALGRVPGMPVGADR